MLLSKIRPKYNVSGTKHTTYLPLYNQCKNLHLLCNVKPSKKEI